MFDCFVVCVVVFYSHVAVEILGLCVLVICYYGLRVVCGFGVMSLTVLLSATCACVLLRWFLCGLLFSMGVLGWGGFSVEWV